MRKLHTLIIVSSIHLQIVAGDLYHVSQSTVCNVVRRVSDVLSDHLRRYIRFPDNLQNVKRQFHKIAAFPGIIGCIDGIHIPIQCPQLERGEIFRNRKGRFSIYVQVISLIINYKLNHTILITFLS